MKIDGVTTPAAAAKAIKHPKPVNEEPPVETAPSELQQGESEEKLPGVLRLLMDGHFKGVADVRLRINFHEEIQALEGAHLTEAAASGFSSFNQTIEGQIAALKDSGLLSEEQIAALDAFYANVQTAQSEFPDGTGLTELMERFQTELETLMGLLNPPAPVIELPVEQTVPEDVVPAEPDEPTETTEPQPAAAEPTELTEPQEPAQEPGAVEPAAEPLTVEPTEPQTLEPSPLQLLVEGFEQSIQEAIDDLQSGLSSTSVLPPISEPSGKGGAYAKFIEIYESMQSGAAEPAPPAPEEILDEVIVPEEPQPLSELA